MSTTVCLRRVAAAFAAGGGFASGFLSFGSGSSSCLEVPEHLHRKLSRFEKEAALYDPPYPRNPDNSIVYFDIGMNGTFIGRVEFEMFDDDSPLLVTNFKALSQGYFKGYPVVSKHPTRHRQHGDRKLISYHNTLFHNVIPGYIIQGGDNELYDGRGGESYCGDILKDCFRGKGGAIPGPGCLCAVNHGRNTNQSQFMVSLRALPHLYGRNSCIGQVVSGWDVVKHMESLGTSSGKSREELSILRCGVSKHKNGKLYDAEDPCNVPPRVDWQEKGAINLSNVEAPKIDMASNPLFNTGWVAPSWKYDARSGDGTGPSKRYSQDLCEDPSMTGC